MGRSNEESMALLPEMTKKADGCSYNYFPFNHIQYRVGCIPKDAKTTTDFKCMDTLSLPTSTSCDYIQNTSWDTAKAYDCINVCIATDHQLSKPEADAIVNSLLNPTPHSEVSGIPLSALSDATLSLYPSAHLSFLTLLLFIIMMFKRTH